MTRPACRLFATPVPSLRALAGGALAMLAAVPAVQAQPVAPVAAAVAATPDWKGGATYADWVDLALASPVVARATVHRQLRLKDTEAPGLQPGTARLYVEADTAAVLVGPDLGATLRFLVDVPLDPRGKVPQFKKTQVLLFGNVVPGKPGDLALARPDAMVVWNGALETGVRAILTALVGAEAPPRITGIREAVHVPGNLVGEGETQVFLTTADARPVALSVLRRPGEPVRWGVSYGELVDAAARPPEPETLAWYRLACALPPAIPERAAISDTPADRQRAAEDYAFVLRALGPCRRTRGAK